MTISALLSPERIFIGADISSKKKLLEFLANTITTQCNLPELTLFNNLFDRERLGSTGLGQGFAIPHARLTNLNTTMGCLVRLKKPINYEAPDNQPVDLVFCIVIPEHATDEHLKILSSLAKIFSQPEVCEAVRNAKSCDQITRIIVDAEQ